jgi:hypothetical protein
MEEEFCDKEEGIDIVTRVFGVLRFRFPVSVFV